ncbi:amino acid ABC transporter permease [Pseudonocardia humida]|uniref:Amino acid ABC transporter permease n=1 Tax=Pseudonocardia humida TaxID=2800819 RepID=A0ABT1ACP8_9PSEU|nr:amino acid ABC transporter permease [Pseudonocardia humida]MCO1660849.1 amino acid ABC transporter permease [Pseudonocardia humida]
MSSVLYDAPGPRARRNTLIGTVIAVVLLAGLVVLAVIQLGENGQLDGEKWGPAFNPANQYFVATWSALGDGLVNTVVAAALTLVLALAIGTALAVARITSSRAYRWLVVSAIELFRGLPVVITIFLAARVLPEFGISLPPLWYLVIGLTAYNCVIIAEIVRAGVNALPRGQSEAAYAVGLTRFQVLRIILLPQAFRIMLPALISQLVVIVKDTSLGFVIFGFSEFVRTANTVIQFFGGQEGINLPLQMYIAVALVFILINYALSKLAEYVQRRTSRAGRAARNKDAAPPAELAPVGVGGAVT